MSGTLKKLLIGAGLLVALSCGWFFLFYQPRVSNLNVAKEEAEQLLLRLQSFQVTDQQIASLETQVAALRNEMKKTQGAVVLKDDLPNVVRQIQRKGRMFGIKFDKIIPDYETLLTSDDEENTSEFLKLTVHMKLQGYYRSFGKFVEALHDLPFLLSVGEVTLAYNEQIFPELDITVDAVLYVRREYKAQT